MYLQGTPNGLPNPLPQFLLPLWLADLNVDCAAKQHQDSYTGPNAIFKISCQFAYARLAHPIPKPEIGVPYTEL